MKRITERTDDITKLPALLSQVKEQLQYHTESGFTLEEANGYSQQLDDLESVLVPIWTERLQGTDYQLQIDCSPKLGGFIKIKVLRGESEPVEVFVETYGHFNSEMCDGSCYQYVYQKVLCYEDGLASGRVPL